MTSVLRQAGSQSLAAQTLLPSVEARISAEVFKKQIRMKTFFEDYDKLRKGFCIEDKFITGLNSALSMLSVNLTSEEIKVLVDKFRVSGSNDLIRYVDFVDELERMFYQPELGRSTLSSIRQPHSVASSEQDSLAQLVNYIKKQVASRRILIKHPLQDYDRTKSGIITKDQFARVLDSLGFVTNPQMADLLARRYINNANPKQVIYTDFIRDVENINESEAFVVKGIVGSVNHGASSGNNIVQNIHLDSLTEDFYVEKKLPEMNAPIEEVLKKVQALVTLKRIRIKEFFYDFDGLRKNVVTGDQFRRVLTMIGITITDQELKEILKVFNVDPEPSREHRVRWIDFCEAVDTVFTKKGLDKDPLAKVSQIDKTVFEPVKRIPLQFTAEEQESLDRLQKSYQTVISQRRLHLKPMFQDFDTTKIGYVTKNQFVRIMKQFDLVPPSEKDLNLLLKRYMDRGNLNDVNYYEFIRDVNLYHEDGKAISAQYASTFTNFQHQPRVSKAAIRSDHPVDLTDLLGRMRAKVREERIRVAEFMKDFDKLRHGFITKDQFRLSLGMTKLPLSEAEFGLIVNAYSSEQEPGKLRWRDFCDHLDEVFNTKELEKTAPQLTVNLAGTDFNYGRAEITQQEQEEAQKIKAAFREYQLSHRLDPKQLFENWDKLSRFKVSPKQFRQVLATVGFELTDEQSRCICKVYRTDDEKEVRYLDFLKDTKPYDFSYMAQTKEVLKHGTGKPRSIPDSVEQILMELRRTTKINRLRYKEYFKDFDPLSKGTLKKNKFKSVVYQTMKIPLDEKYFNILEAAYQCPNDNTLINYWHFCDDMDVVFNLPDNHKDPLERPMNFEFSSNPLEKSDTKIGALLAKLGEAIRKHRLLLKPFFQDKDIAKIGRVSFTRMRSILDNNKLPLTQEQYQILCKAFTHNQNEFDYLAFIDALKLYESTD